jgi:hypothetical protein
VSEIYGREPTTPGFVTLTTNGIVIPAASGKRIRVFGLFVNSLAATQVRFQSNGVDISGTFSLAATGGFVLPHVQKAWMITNSGEALSLFMSVNTTVGIQVLYDLSPSNT